MYGLTRIPTVSRTPAKAASPMSPFVLYDSTGSEVGRTITDANGGYLFTGLPADTYYVDVLDGTDGTAYTLPDYDGSGATNDFTQTPPSTHADSDFGNQDHSTATIPTTALTGISHGFGGGGI